MARAAALVVASAVLGVFATLTVNTVALAEPKTAGERMLTMEAKLDAMATTQGQVQTQMAAAVEKITELQSKVSMISGVGLGLSSIVVILQFLSLAPRTQVPRRDDG